MTSPARFRLPFFAILAICTFAALFTPAFTPAAAFAEEAESGLLATVATSGVREAADYSFRRWLRNRVWDEEDEARYGLQLEDGWREAAEASP